MFGGLNGYQYKMASKCAGIIEAIRLPETAIVSSIVHKILAVVYIENQCCTDRPILITSNTVSKSKERPDGINYSCQCACGMWCTSGHASAGEALMEYETMNKLNKSKFANEEF